MNIAQTAWLLLITAQSWGQTHEQRLSITVQSETKGVADWAFPVEVRCRFEVGRKGLPSRIIVKMPDGKTFRGLREQAPEDRYQLESNIATLLLEPPIVGQEDGDVTFPDADDVCDRLMSLIGIRRVVKRGMPGGRRTLYPYASFKVPFQVYGEQHERRFGASAHIRIKLAFDEQYGDSFFLSLVFGGSDIGPGWKRPDFDYDKREWTNRAAGNDACPGRCPGPLLRLTYQWERK